MTKEEAIKEKKIAIANTIIDSANGIASILKTIPSSQKKLFQKKNRRPMRKQKTKAVFARAAMQLYMDRMRVINIIQQPIPRFPQGGETSKGLAIVGDNGKKEIIIKND